MSKDPRNEASLESFVYEPRHTKMCLREFQTRSDSILPAQLAWGLNILVTETRDITLSRQRITKALIRCAG